MCSTLIMYSWTSIYCLKYILINQDNISLYVNILAGQPQKKVSSKYSQDIRNLIAELMNKEPHKRPSVCAILER